MGYGVTIILLVLWFLSGGQAKELLIPAGLFAIAGAISLHN